jgi:hypothetical protein
VQTSDEGVDKNVQTNAKAGKKSKKATMKTRSNKKTKVSFTMTSNRNKENPFINMVRGMKPATVAKWSRDEMQEMAKGNQLGRSDLKEALDWIDAGWCVGMEI